MKNYDGLFIFAGSPKDEVLEKAIERIAAEIARLGGSVRNREILGRRGFSRPMKKKESGVYVKVRFALDPANVAALGVRFKLQEEIFRVQVTTVEERKAPRKSAERRAPEAQGSAAAAPAPGAEGGSRDA